MPSNIAFRFSTPVGEGRRRVTLLLVGGDHEPRVVDSTARAIAVTSLDARRRWLGSALTALAARDPGHGHDLGSLEESFLAFLEGQEADERAAEERDEQAGGGVTGHALRVLPELPDEPADLASWRMPPRWHVERDPCRVWHPDHGEVPAPVLVVARSRDLAGGGAMLRLRFWRDDAWSEPRDYPRSTLADPKKILALADHDVPVIADNARVLVRFIAEFEQANLGRIPAEQTSQVMGWIDDRHFLWGERLLGDDGLRVRFQGRNAGDDQFAAAFHASACGSLEDWKANVALVRDRPVAMAMVLGALGSPLLAPLGLDGFVLDVNGATSVGKTTTLRLAASAWGQPDETRKPAVVASWSMTRTAIGLQAGVAQHLPLPLDETQLAAHPEEIPATIYDLSNGQGKARGARGGGLQATDSWRLIVISTGERPISGLSQDGGVLGRTVELAGDPLPPRNAELAGEITRRAKACFGFAGPAFVEWLLARLEDRRAEWLGRYAELEAEERAAAGGEAIAGRCARHVATLRLTFELAMEAGILPAGVGDPMLALRGELYALKVEQDRPREALLAVLDYANAHPDEFEGSGYGSDTFRAYRRLSGRWEGGAVETCEWLGVIPGELERILKASGHDPNRIRRDWQGRGWLVTSKGRKDYQAKIGSSTKRLVAIRGEALRGALGLEEPGGAGGSPRGAGLRRKPRPKDALAEVPGVVVGAN